MVGIVLPAHVPPEIRIDDADDDLVAMLNEERFELGRQDVDGAPHDVAMGREAPGGRRRRQQRDREHHDQESAAAAAWHPGILPTRRPRASFHGQPDSHAVRRDAGPDAARPGRARDDHGARPRVECTRRRHHHRGARRGCLPSVAPRSDARAAGNHRPGGGDRRNRLGRPAVHRPQGRAPRRRAKRHVPDALRSVRPRRAVPHPDGLPDVVRYAPSESVQLALVRRRSDADRRRVPGRSPVCRPPLRAGVGSVDGAATRRSCSR